MISDERKNAKQIFAHVGPLDAAANTLDDFIVRLVEY